MSPDPPDRGGGPGKGPAITPTRLFAAARDAMVSEVEYLGHVTAMPWDFLVARMALHRPWEGRNFVVVAVAFLREEPPKDAVSSWLRALGKFVCPSGGECSQGRGGGPRGEAAHRALMLHVLQQSWFDSVKHVLQDKFGTTAEQDAMRPLPTPDEPDSFVYIAMFGREKSLTAKPFAGSQGAFIAWSGARRKRQLSKLVGAPTPGGRITVDPMRDFKTLRRAPAVAVQDFNTGPLEAGACGGGAPAVAVAAI